MNKVLAPIHYKMNNKILYLEDLALMLKEQLGIKKIKDMETVNRGSLENIIDFKDIHGWLSRRVDKVEDTFAKILSQSLKENKVDSLLKLMYQKGFEENFLGNGREAYLYIEDTFLNGMPCDNSVKAWESNGEIYYKEVKDIHSCYYIYDVDSQIYYDAKNSWVKGLLKKSNLKLLHDGKVNRIVKHE
ncbi:hypothetical protein [Lagierella sp.]|uniref:hypothetical protein n=1 Tax=Lagierella sp. TaxID=2849657 RepID=UPI00261DA53F|nr:hypothetical protein [Lagierella sp.]